jgi:Replication-relaxation
MTMSCNPRPQLTARDREIVALVYEYGGVLVAHICRRYFATPGGRSACYRRIALLAQHGYLSAVRLPAQGGQGSGPSFLTIGTAARPLLASMLGVSSAELGRIEHSFAPLFVQHHSAICDTRLAIDLAVQQTGTPVQLVEWIPERELKRQPLRLTDPKTDATAPIVPDAALTLQLPDGRSQQLYLEQDMATVAPRRMRSKVRLYLALRAGTPGSPIILMVTTTARRQAALASWIADEAAWLRKQKSIPADATRFFLTTTEHLNERTVLTEPIWQVVDGPERFSLAPPTAPAHRTSEHRTPLAEAAS